MFLPHFEPFAISSQFCHQTDDSVVLIAVAAGPGTFATKEGVAIGFVFELRMPGVCENIAMLGKSGHIPNGRKKRRQGNVA
jgi:hypothetical protein